MDRGAGDAEANAIEVRKLLEKRQFARRRLVDQIREAIGVEVEIVSDDVSVRRGLAMLEQLVRHTGAAMWPTAPTRERVAKMGGDPIPIVIHKDQPRAHRVGSYLSNNAKLIPPHEYSAADRLKTAYEVRMGGSRIGNLDGVVVDGGAAKTGRDMLTDRQLAAFELTRAGLLGFSERERAIIDNFVLEVSPAGMDRPLTVAEFGLAYWGTRSEKLARSLVWGAVSIVLGAIAERIKWHDARKRKAAEGREIAGRAMGECDGPFQLER